MHADIKGQQIEFEVFSKESQKEKKPYAYLSKIKSDVSDDAPAINVVFSPQAVIIIFICLLLSLIASFSLGVEKGKLLAKNDLRFQAPLTAQAPPETVRSVKKTTPEEKTSAAEAVTKTVEKAKATEEPKTATETKTEPGSYTIQVASLKSKKSAANLADSLVKKGLFSFVRASGKYQVVLAGNFEERAEARVALKELKKKFNDCFIKKI